MVKAAMGATTVRLVNPMLRVGWTIALAYAIVGCGLEDVGSWLRVKKDSLTVQ